MRIYTAAEALPVPELFSNSETGNSRLSLGVVYILDLIQKLEIATSGYLTAIDVTSSSRANNGTTYASTTRTHVKPALIQRPYRSIIKTNDPIRRYY